MIFVSFEISKLRCVSSAIHACGAVSVYGSAVIGNNSMAKPPGDACRTSPVPRLDYRIGDPLSEEGSIPFNLYHSLFWNGVFIEQ